MSNYRRGRSELTVGLYTVGAVVVFALLFGGLTNRGLIRTSSDLYVRLPTADGLLKGDAVLFRGVPVGDVRDIDFGDGGDVVVRAKLRRRVPLTRAATAALTPVDMFGRQAIELRAGSAAGSGSPAADSGGLTVAARRRPLRSGDTLVGEPPVAMVDRVDALSRQLERVVGDSTLALVRAALTGVGGAGDGLTEAGAQATAFLAAQSRNLDAVTAASGEVLRNLATATDSAEVTALRAELQVAVARLGRAAARMDSASAVAMQLLARLERGDGAVGRALADPVLYDRATGAIVELERLLADVREHPGRYLTVKIF